MTLKAMNDPMKRASKTVATAALLLACVMAFGACQTTKAQKVHRFVTFNDKDPYYRVYYRDKDGRMYYRQYYYEDDQTNRSRLDRRRHYYTKSASKEAARMGY
jgi:hypothetical protein